MAAIEIPSPLLWSVDYVFLPDHSSEAILFLLLSTDTMNRNCRVPVFYIDQTCRQTGLSRSAKTPTRPAILGRDKITPIQTEGWSV